MTAFNALSFFIDHHSTINSNFLQNQHKNHSIFLVHRLHHLDFEMGTFQEVMPNFLDTEIFKKARDIYPNFKHLSMELPDLLIYKPDFLRCDLLKLNVWIRMIRFGGKNTWTGIAVKFPAMRN